jgi:hypothetical protein
MKRAILPFFLILPIGLASCSGLTPTSVPGSTQTFEIAQSNPAPVQSAESVPPPIDEADTSSDMTRSDQQGAVVVSITPLNLADSSEQLEFDVVLETHSVDLSMDLAVLSSLTTDTGVIMQATLWDAPRGGHHVSGKLIFPALSDGRPILEGASRLTLTILDVDAPSRVFEWQLN